MNDKQQKKNNDKKIKLLTEEQMKEYNKKKAQRLEMEKRKAEHERDKMFERQKIELLKVQNGLEDESILKEPEHIAEKPKGLSAVENFIYHYGAFVVIGLAFIFICTVLLINILDREKPDLNVICVSSFPENYDKEKLEDYFNSIGKDLNDDGKVNIDFIYIDFTTCGNDPTAMLALETKLSGEFGSGKTYLIISDDYGNRFIDPSETLENMTLKYPMYADINKYGLKLNTDIFKEKVGIDELSDNMFLGIYKPSENFGSSSKKTKAAYQNSVDFFEILLADLYKSN